VRHDRHGFALIVVLWVILGLSVLAFGASLAARSALAGTRNRAALTTAWWRADGCVERTRAAIADTIRRLPPGGVMAFWDTVDRVIARSPYLRGTSCVIHMRASGAALDINRADAERLRRLFNVIGIRPARADSLIDALLDWRDTDTIPRPNGAERGWYRAHHRRVPRDSAFGNVQELLRVRGFEHFGDTLALFGVDGGLMPLSHTPLPVLASLPGLSPTVVTHIAQRRARGEWIPELVALEGGLSADDHEQFLAHYQELMTLTSVVPETWMLTASVTAGEPAVAGVVTVQLGRAGTRVAVLGRR